MASSLVQGFLATLETISHSPHPYAAIADYITTMTLLPKRPVWAQVLSVGNLIASVFMLCVATLTCAIQIQKKRFSLGRINPDHIVRPNAAVCFAIGCIGYSTMSIAELCLEMAQEQSPRDSNARGRAALTGIKGVCLWEGAWCFSWSSAGQFICAKWRPPWQADSTYDKIPRLVVFSLNSTFILMAIIAAGFPVIGFTMVEHYEKEALSLVTFVVKELYRIDRDPKAGYSLGTALLVLQPLYNLLPTLDTIILLLKITTMAWICTLIVAILAQAALIGFSLYYQHEMGVKCSVWNTCLQMLKIRPDEKPSTSSALNYFRERDVTVILSATILITGTSFIPLAIWQYYNTTLEHFTSVSYWLVLDLSSSCVLSVVVNVVMFATLKQIIRLSQPVLNNETVVSSDKIRMQKSIWRAGAKKSKPPQVHLEQSSGGIEWDVAKYSSSDTADLERSQENSTVWMAE